MNGENKKTIMLDLGGEVRKMIDKILKEEYVRKDSLKNTLCIENIVTAFRARANCFDYSCKDCPANNIICGDVSDDKFEEIADTIERYVK